MKRFEIHYSQPGLKSLAARQNINVAFIQADNEKNAVYLVKEQVGHHIRVEMIEENEDGTLK